MFLVVTHEYTLNTSFSHLCRGVCAENFVQFLSCLLGLFGVCDCSPTSHTFAFPRCAWLAEILMNNRLQTANNESRILLPARRSYYSYVNTYIMESRIPAFRQMAACSRKQSYLCSTEEALCLLTLRFLYRTWP